MHLNIDETTNQSGSYIINASTVSATISQNASANLYYANALSSTISKRNSQSIPYVVGTSSDASIYDGTLTFYIDGIRSAANIYSAQPISQVSNFDGYTTIINSAKLISNAVGYNNRLTVAAATLVDFYTGSNSYVSNIYGVNYEGIISTSSNNSGLNKNHYAIFLSNIDKATNNYSIYTNAGKLRFGDLNSTNSPAATAAATDCPVC